MEGKPSPHLKKVLKSYQLSAANTMSGPSSVLSRHENGISHISINSQHPNSSHHRARNSLDTSVDSLATAREILHQTFKHQQQSYKSNPVLHRSISLGSQNLVTNYSNKNSALQINGIKREPGSAGKGGSTLIIQPAPLSSASLPKLPPIAIQSGSSRARAEQSDTFLEGTPIPCFSVGGEKRLCFPAILTTVLRGVSLAQINKVCDDLRIFCSFSSAEQLDVLKGTGVIPSSAQACGLVKKSDAERLVNSLLHRNPPKAAVSFLSAVNRPQDPKKPQSNSHFRVYHECFGEGRGVVLPHLYDKPDSLCIECVNCHGLFSPQRFVSHSHQQENLTCHWGFDSSNWRKYLMVSEDQENRDKLEKSLEDFKGRFDQKRKESVSSSSTEDGMEDRVVIKRVRLSNPVTSPAATSPSSFLSSNGYEPLHLPTKKRMTKQYSSETEQFGINEVELETVKKMIESSMGKEGAEIVNGLFDKMSSKISSLEQVCLTQGKLLRAAGVNEPKTSPGTELQTKVNIMESELHSLKKQLLRRHGEEMTQ